MLRLEASNNSRQCFNPLDSQENRAIWCHNTLLLYLQAFDEKFSYFEQRQYKKDKSNDVCIDALWTLDVVVLHCLSSNLRFIFFWCVRAQMNWAQFTKPLHASHSNVTCTCIYGWLLWWIFAAKAFSSCLVCMNKSMLLHCTKACSGIHIWHFQIKNPFSLRTNLRERVNLGSC